MFKIISKSKSVVKVANTESGGLSVLWFTKEKEKEKKNSSVGGRARNKKLNWRNNIFSLRHPRGGKLICRFFFGCCASVVYEMEDPCWLFFFFLTR